MSTQSDSYPLVIAHRGASRAFPENTLAAFRGAWQLGADWVELDVRCTSDGVLVVHHDATVADGLRPIAGLAAGDLDPSIPTLAEVLAVCEQHGVNVEIKNSPDDLGFDESRHISDAVVAALAGADRSLLLVSSFDAESLDRVRQLDPGIATARLGFDIGDRDRFLEGAALAGHTAVNPWDPLVDAVFVEAAHARGLRVYPWTVDDPHRMAELVASGVDGIITNVPDVLRSLLDRIETSP